jgi:CheY-like chemotaxis protein/tRNA A-37 threonylcarbamoyl transferase component Bud32
MRVLAADDDEAILRMLARALRSWGYEPILASGGVEAWHVLRQELAPTVAILDWDMPGLSGIEVCRLFRATPHGAGAYVLVLTARQQKDDLIEALEAGADDFLSKPFVARELQLRLAKGFSARGTQARARANAPAAPENPPAGITLGGKVRLERKIAEGGMATVWLGVHLALGINVAVKFMKAHLTDTADYASFEREARAVAQLRSEHIVRVYDHGIGHDGLPYLVMEYLGGESLAARIDRQGPLSLAEVGWVVERVARALNEAHAHGIVHRDIKPENIFLVDDPDRPGEFGVKLVDFGLAKSSATQAPSEPATLAGTPSYMSPEYLRGEAAPDPRLDLWGLAATAFAAMTGTMAFPGQSVAEIYERVCEAALPVPSAARRAVPTAFDAWFTRACARDPSRRFTSAVELSEALSRACGSGGESPATSEPPSGRPWAFERTEPDTARAMRRAAPTHEHVTTPSETDEGDDAPPRK